MLNIIAPRIPMIGIVRIILYEMPPEYREPKLRSLVQQIIEESDTEILAASRLQYLRQILADYGMDKSLINIAKNADLTKKLNNRSTERFYQRATQEQIIPADFAKQRVIDRLATYIPNQGKPTLPMIADVMIAGSMRPSEITTLYIFLGPDCKYLAEGYAKSRGAAPRPFISLIDTVDFRSLLTWIQREIEAGLFRTSDMSYLMRKWLKKHYNMSPRQLRAIGSIYIAENTSNSMAGRAITQRIALRHKRSMVASECYGTYTTQPETQDKQ